MRSSDLIACLCEGSMEQAIMEILLENNRLIFEREQLLEEEILRCRSAKKKYAKNYGNMEFFTPLLSLKPRMSAATKKNAHQIFLFITIITKKYCKNL